MWSDMMSRQFLFIINPFMIRMIINLPEVNLTSYVLAMSAHNNFFCLARRICVLSREINYLQHYYMYHLLYYATENTVNQNAGKPFYIHQYSTETSHRSVQFNCITPNLPIWLLYLLWHNCIK